MKDRLDLWRGAFGDAYHDRNGIEESNVRARAKWLREVLARIPLPDPKSILEVGCGNGANLQALRVACDDMDIKNVRISGAEPNRSARKRAREGAPHACVYEWTADNLFPLNNSEFDLVFTSGVLIHIPGEGLPDAMAGIHRVAKRHILCAEYYGRDVEEVPYHGEEGALWRRPYGDLWVEQFPGLKPLAQGFAWKRTTGLDDLVWFLFEKPTYSNNTNRAW